MKQSRWEKMRKRRRVDDEWGRGPEWGWRLSEGWSWVPLLGCAEGAISNLFLPKFSNPINGFLKSTFFPESSFFLKKKKTYNPFQIKKNHHCLSLNYNLTLNLIQAFESSNPLGLWTLPPSINNHGYLVILSFSPLVSKPQVLGNWEGERPPTGLETVWENVLFLVYCLPVAAKSISVELEWWVWSIQFKQSLFPPLTKIIDFKVLIWRNSKPKFKFQIPLVLD